MLKSDQHEGECAKNIIPPPQEQKLSGLVRELQSLELCLYLVFPPVSYTDQKPRVKKTITVGQLSCLSSKFSFSFEFITEIHNY